MGGLRGKLQPRLAQRVLLRQPLLAQTGAVNVSFSAGLRSSRQGSLLMRWFLAATVGPVVLVAACAGGDDDEAVGPTGSRGPSGSLTATAPATLPPVQSPCPVPDLSIYRVEIDTGKVSTLGQGENPKLSQDGSLLSYLSLAEQPNCVPTMFVDSVISGQHLFSKEGVYTASEWSPTEAALALGANGNQPSEVTIISISEDEASTNTIFRGLVNDISWSGDGSRIAFIDGETGDISVYGLEYGTTRKLPSLPISERSVVVQAEWSPRDELLAVWTYEPQPSGPNVSRLFLVSPIDGSSNEVLDPPGGSLPSWSPDGSFLSFNVSEGGTSSEYMVAIDGPSSSRSFPGANGIWAPDGTILAYVDDCETWDISVVAPDGTGDHVLAPAAPDQVQLPWSWSPDSSLLAYSDKQHTYAVTRDGQVTQLPPHMRKVTWSPDGRYLIGTKVAGHGLC